MIGSMITSPESINNTVTPIMSDNNRRQSSSRNRHIEDISILSQYCAAPIYDVDSSDYDSVISNHTGNDNNNNNADDVSTFTAMTPTYVTGISISDWDIQTLSSTIANETEMEMLTTKLQTLANSNEEGTTRSSCTDDVSKMNPTIQRRLNIPEIVFLNALVQLKLKRKHGFNEEEFKLIVFSWNASDALEEWASCHSHLSNGANFLQGNSNEESYRGVSIVKSIDAKLWSERHKKQQIKSNEDSDAYFNQSAITNTNNEFNYDWTFSTPYIGTSTIVQNTSETNYQKESLEWIPSTTSMIDLSYLTDTTQPILYYDEINLYEDDMHDNGYVSLRCKVRIMPTCLFLLQTLFVRVDHVLIRVREVRTFCTFEPTNDDVQSPTYRICRDISWRECKWAGLSSHNLPEFVGSWRIEDENSGPANQQRIQGFIRSLPLVDLPEDVHQYSYVDVSG